LLVDLQPDITTVIMPVNSIKHFWGKYFKLHITDSLSVCECVNEAMIRNTVICRMCPNTGGCII